jgi:hypothetical protein
MTAKVKAKNRTCKERGYDRQASERKIDWITADVVWS